MHHEPLRYAHDEGHTDVSFSSDGSKFTTCGADGDVRIWSAQENEVLIHNCVGEWALSVRQKGDSWYVATGSNEIQILTLSEGERNGVLCRSIAPINQVAISKNSEHMALAGEDMEVKLINLAEDKTKTVIFDGLTGPCLSVAVNSEFVAASSGDGKLRIWNIENKELLKEIECFPKVNSFANTKNLCRIDFEPVSGKYLAYPDKDTIILLDTFDWSQASGLKCNEIAADFSIIEFSPCGNFLVAATVQGDFVVFSVNANKVVGVSKHPTSKRVCGLTWNPTENGQVVYTDTEGQLGIMTGCIPKEQPRAEPGFVDNDVDFGDVQFEDDDEDGENVISVEKLKKQVMGDVESELNFDTRSRSAAPTPRPRTPEIPLQPPFMPSSTPDHLDPRFLCWNEVGVIRSYGSSSEEDSAKSIEIEFHDSTFHNSMMLQNYQDYTFGSLSTAALAVANLTQLCVIPLSATSKEWVLKLEESTEEIVLITASENLICFGTNNYMVRVCSIFGTQRGLLAIPGPLVSMASSKNSLLVAYHAGTVRKGDQCIRIKWITFNGLSMQCLDIDSALGPESTLAWLGFTDSGTPAMMNSLGLISLYPKDCNVWVPFCDTARHLKNPSDGFFVTAVMESCQTLMGIKCRGSVYPSVTPRPTVCELPLEPPFAEPTTEKTQLEMSLFSWTNLQVKDVGKRFMEAGLKTFALACKNNLDQRALELMEIIGNPTMLSLSTKYAVKMNKKLLAEKLMEMATKILNEDDDLSNSFVDRSLMTPPMKEPSKRLTLSSIKKKTKQVSQEVATPDRVTTSQNSVQSPAPTVDSQRSPQESIVAEEPKNPFLKSAKKTEESHLNPLSLTNKFAGVDLPKENEKKKPEITEKRKRPDSDNENQREKQRKLDRFMFSKRS